MNTDATPRATADDIAEAERLVREARFESAVAMLTPFAVDERAAAVLGDIYANAKFEGADDAKARAYYRAAAEGGHAVAQHNLGWLLVDDGDLEAALAGWEKSSAAGVSESSLALYGYHRRHTSMALAIPYLERGAAQGNPLAVNTLAHKQMRGEYGLAAIPAGVLRWIGNMVPLARYLRANRRDIGLK